MIGRLRNPKLGLFASGGTEERVYGDDTRDKAGALYRELQAAQFLNVSVKTLQRWRWEGRGPRWRKLIRAVRYTKKDLDQFVEASGRNSTSEGA